MAVVIFIVRKLTEAHSAKTRITKESSLYNVVILISVTSIKTSLIDKNMLSIKKQITREPVDYQKKKKKPTMEYNEKLYGNPYENLGKIDKFLEK